jgi:DNA polymerase IV
MIAKKMRETVETELGITVSVGVRLSKVLAKTAWGYPNTANGHSQLSRKTLGGKGMGDRADTTVFLKKFGITAALQFAKKDEEFIQKYFSKPYHRIWQKLNGRLVYSVVTESKSRYTSISKVKTLPLRDETFVFAQLSKNLKNACINARSYKLVATRLVVFLRTQEFIDIGVEIKLSRPTAYPVDLFGLLKEGSDQLYRPHSLFRQTGVSPCWPYA